MLPMRQNYKVSFYKKHDFYKLPFNKIGIASISSRYGILG